jgi:hypothetical protein
VGDNLAVRRVDDIHDLVAMGFNERPVNVFGDRFHRASPFPLTRTTHSLCAFAWAKFYVDGMGGGTSASITYFW